MYVYVHCIALLHFNWKYNANNAITKLRQQ